MLGGISNHLKLLVFALPSRAEHALMSEERGHSGTRKTEAKMDAETTQTKTENDAMLRLAEHSAAQLHAQIIESCRQAVVTLEDFAAKARREVERAGELEPGELAGLPSALASQAAWGAANAASELSTATRMATQYLNALGIVEALKRGAK
jgi:hypothetical protein